MSWTSSHKIPTPEDGRINTLHVVSVMGDAWVFGRCYIPFIRDYRLKVFNFKADIQQSIEVDVETPESFPSSIVTCVSHRNNVYMTGYDTFVDFGVFFDRGVIFEFNTTSLSLSQLFSSDNGIPYNLMFFNNYMHFVNPVRDDLHDYIVIDLDTKQFVDITPFVFPPHVKNVDCKLINNQFCITGNLGSDRFAAVWQNRAFYPVSTKHENVDWDDTECGFTFCEKFMYKEDFDFEAGEWKKTIIPKPWLGDDSLRLQSITETNDKIYAIICNAQHRNPELRIFERQPALTDICLLNVAKGLVPGDRISEIRDVMKIIPDSLGDRLIKMVNWRLDENEIGRQWSLHLAQCQAFRVEIEKMQEDGLIDECLHQSLYKKLCYSLA